MENGESVRVMSFFGPPGSGKGTIAQRCVKDFGWVMLSTGDLCRRHIQSESELGLEFKKFVHKGQLIPDELISRMVLDWLKEQKKSNSNIILDGFPRTKGQAYLLLSALGEDSDLSGISFEIVNFDLDSEELVKRISSRLVCSNKDCQEVYSAIVKKPVAEGSCDLCGKQLIRRPDDEEAVVRERLKVFSKFKNDLLGFYDEADSRVINFSVPEGPPDVVFEAFVKFVG